METVGIPAASWVVGKALSPLSGGVLEAWGASSMLGSNMETLKMQLLYAQAMLNNVRGRKIHNPALGEMLDKLRQLAYGAEDVLDELDYFRIQDELDGTYHAADVHAAGCVQDVVLNARHTARACVNKLKLPACSRAATRGDPDRQQDGCKQGFFSCICSCGPSPPSPTDKRDQVGSVGCMPKVASSARDAACTVGKHFSCYSFPSWSSNAQHRNHATQAPKLKFDRVEMSNKIRNITDELKPVCAMVSTILSLELLGSSHSPTQDVGINRPKTTPQIIEPKLYGRDRHKNIIKEEIANVECGELTVLPIVGPGGIGKTTFTQHIYEQMKSHFQVPIWICVSLDFNANRLAKDIVKQIPEVDTENKNCSDGELIKQRIKGKRVLLVLDDVWTHHETEWNKLISLFKTEGTKGNMVIITTRIPEVANTVKTTKCSLELERLCPEDIMSFFEECVFGDQKPWVDHPGLSDVGSKIVDKLKGSPLAAKTVGRLLRNKLTLNHWNSVLESKEWESQINDNDIMPALKLSYDYLPFHLQQCFSFCGLFPEDYEFGSKELVLLWIGQDILRLSDLKKKRIEDVGLCYLNDLVNYGFFKLIEKENGHRYYVIHDLLHELAVKVSSYECLSIYSSNARDIQIPPAVRHLSIIVDNTDVKDKISFEDYDGNLSALAKCLKVENLHTLMLFGHYHGNFAKTFGDLFKEARALRIIFLSEVTYNMEDILHNFPKLVHLRYLRIKTVYYWKLCLPSSLFRLYHLQVIDLQNVHLCFGSTRHMNNLVKMRHFLVPKHMLHLQSDIFRVGKLKFFQELREFRVGKESEGFELSQLGQSTEIGGSLGIYNLEKVKTKEEASELKLVHKNHLRELILEWDAMRPNKDPLQEENVLGSLVPHSNLQELRIKGHGGTNCPTWLCAKLSVKNVESLCLDGVSWKNLPPLGDLWMVNESGEEYQGCGVTSPPIFHNLKMLELRNISRLKKWVGKGTCPFFSHLEVLTIKHCAELMELPFCEPTGCQVQLNEKMAWFPKLHELVIVDCLKLEPLPPIPWQAHAPFSASIERVGSVIEELAYQSKGMPKVSLQIKGKGGGQGDVFWNVLNFSNLTGLKELDMNKIPPLPLDDLRGLTSLKKIAISNLSCVLPPVECESHGIYRFPVEDLDIAKCDASGKELTLLLSFLPNLSKLRISKCENITALGVVEQAETVSGEQRQKTGVGEEEIITDAAAEGLLLLPPQLQELRILECPNVSLLPNPPPDDVAEAAARGGGEGGLHRLRSLRVLLVAVCPEFLSSYSSSSCSFPPFPTCLQDLFLWGLRYMETLQALSNLTSLTRLSLSITGDSRSDGLWPLLAHGRLTTLTLYTTSDFFAGSDPSRPHDAEVYSSPSKLVHLTTNSKTGFLAAPICSLFSSTLTRLVLSFDNEVERFTKEQEEVLQLLTSLQQLEYWSGQKLQRLPAGLHKLINLKKLRIRWCDAIRLLPSLPSSLQELQIDYCAAIQSLPDTLPSSLERLEIKSCASIKSLPKGDLPSSMLELVVYDGNSEELKRDCRKLIGTIPIIKA